MSIRFQCPACGAIHGINERAIGRRIRCRDCNELVEVQPYSAPESALGIDDLEILDEIEEDYGLDETEDPAEAQLAPPPAPPPIIAPPPIVAPPEAAAMILSPPPIAQRKLRKRSLIRRDRALLEAEMDMTPMVDVTFQLLIFFMLT